MQIKFQVNLSDIWIIVCLQTEWVWLLHKINNISASESQVSHEQAGMQGLHLYSPGRAHPSILASENQIVGAMVELESMWRGH